MSKLFQIYEDDLETLEQALPEIMESLPADIANRQDIREHLEMVKKILSDVRWNYGPHKNIEEFNLGQDPD